MIENERKFLGVGEGIIWILGRMKSSPHFNVLDAAKHIKQWYAPTHIGNCNLRLRCHSTEIVGDGEQEDQPKLTLTTTFKSPTRENRINVRNEFETVGYTTQQEVDHLISELGIGYSLVQKVRYTVAYINPVDHMKYWLELDVYPNGTVVIEIENPPVGDNLGTPLEKFIDTEITGDANWLNSNYQHMQLL